MTVLSRKALTVLGGLLVGGQITLMAGGAAATVQIFEPGFGNTVVATGLPYIGNTELVVRDDGVYVAYATTRSVIRYQKDGSSETFMDGYSSETFAMTFRDDTAYVTQNTSPSDLILQKTIGSPGTAVSATTASPLGTENMLAIEFLPAGFGSDADKMVVGTRNGAFIIDGGASAPLVNGTNDGLWNSFGLSPSGDFVGLAGSSTTSFDLTRINPGGTTDILVADIPMVDGLAIHPVTGDYYLSQWSTDKILKIDADTLIMSDFADLGSDALNGQSNGFGSHALGFSPDGSELWYLSTLYEGLTAPDWCGGDPYCEVEYAEWDVEDSRLSFIAMSDGGGAIPLPSAVLCLLPGLLMLGPRLSRL